MGIGRAARHPFFASRGKDVRMSRINDVLDRPLARSGLSGFTETLIEPLAQLRSEVDRLFDSFAGRWPSVRSSLPAGLLVPAVDMTETNEAFRLSVEVPGMDATDIEMHVHDGAVQISGEKKDRREKDEKGYFYSERSYGAFERRIELPPSADPQGVKAKVCNGVLEITVPKKPEAASKRTRIKIESA